MGALMKALPFRPILALAVAVATLEGNAGSASAQAYTRDFQLQTFMPAPGRGNFLTVEGARVDGHLRGSLSFLANYGHQPLRFRIPGDSFALVKHNVTIDAMGSINFGSFFELGVALPIIAYQAGEAATIGGAVVEPAAKTAAGLGDPRLHLKFDLLNGWWGDVSDMFGLALIGVFTAPLGNQLTPNEFFGSSSITAAPKLAFEVKWEKVRLGFNVGYRWQEDRSFWQARTSDQITFGAALDWKIIEHLVAVFETYGWYGLRQNAASVPLEAYAALKGEVARDVWLTVGGGAGLITSTSGLDMGLGSPNFRVFTGIRWEPTDKPVEAPKDADGDGITDDKDKCVNDPEDKDGFEDEDGCPDPDNDKDGVADAQDECPLVAGVAENKGCPDKDTDGDGVVDRLDKCPTVPGLKNFAGCPEPDDDKDGLVNSKDQCPNEPEDKDGIQDEDGCPEKDADTDGILDPKDKCPLQPEIFNGNEDEDGCPDEGQQLMKLAGNKLEIIEKVNFKTGSSTIDGKGSFKVLDAVASLMKSNDELKIRVEGHTDNKGKRDYNVKLSKERAQACVDYLVGKKGIAADRLASEGFGPDRPIATNDTEQGRATNRRTEFHVLELK